MKNTNFDIIKLFSTDITFLLKYIKNNQPELLSNQLHHIDEEGQSFLYNIIKKNSSYQYSINNDVIQFLLDEGYDFFKDIKEPDYLRMIRTLSDDDLLFLLKHGYEHNKNIIEIFNKDYAVHLTLEFEKNKSFEFLYSHGVDIRSQNKRSENLLNIAHKSATKLATYNRVKDTYNKENIEDKENSFHNMIIWIKSEAKKSQNYYNYDEFLNTLTPELLKADEYQQELLISHLITFKEFSILNKALKVIGKSLKTYKPKHIPLWSELQKCENQKFFYHIFENYSDLGTASFKFQNKNNSPESEVFFLNKLIKFLNLHKVSFYDSDSYRNRGGSEEAKKHKIREIVGNILNNDMLTQHNEKENNSWFITLLKNEQYCDEFQYHIKRVSIPIELITLNNKELYRELLSKTWFYKIKDQYAIDYLLSKKSFYISFDKIKLFTNENIQYLQTWQKEILINSLLKKFGKSEVDSSNPTVLFLNNLIENSIEDDLFNWNNIEVTDDINNISKENFYNQVQAIKLHYKINNSISQKSSTTSKKKI